MRKRRVIAMLGTMDTKGNEIRFFRNLIEAHGHRGFVIDTSSFKDSPADVDVPRSAIAKAGGLGKRSMQKLDRERATELMQKGTREVVWKLYQEGKIDGLLVLGGSGGTSIALSALASLPVGFPKILVTAMSFGSLGGMLDGTDVMVINPVTDILGLNSVNRGIFENVAAAVCAMVERKKSPVPHRGSIGVSSFGVTTPAVMAAKAILEKEGYDVMVFPSNGIGGRILERLTREGVIQGVLDLTITELADEVAGGILSAGPERLEAPGKLGIPHVIAPGAIDIVNFRVGQPLPARLRRRLFYRHSQVTLLMRTSLSESQKLGKLVAQKLNKAKGKVAVMIPWLGFSAYDKKGKVFYDPKADAAFIKALRKKINSTIEVVEQDYHINDEEFAKATAQKLINFMKSKATGKKSSLQI
jgi:uncharacterized protein (UPF0261 family)